MCHLEIDLKNREEVVKARHEAAESVSEHRKKDAELAIGEVLANSLEHANIEDDQIIIDANQEEVVIRANSLLSHHSEIKEAINCPHGRVESLDDPYLHDGDDKACGIGRGFLIVKSIADDVIAEPGLIRLKFAA